MNNIYCYLVTFFVWLTSWHRRTERYTTTGYYELCDEYSTKTSEAIVLTVFVFPPMDKKWNSFAPSVVHVCLWIQIFFILSMLKHLQLLHRQIQQRSFLKKYPTLLWCHNSTSMFYSASVKTNSWLTCYENWYKMARKSSPKFFPGFVRFTVLALNGVIDFGNTETGRCRALRYLLN